jgi:hypothetical protein
LDWNSDPDSVLCHCADITRAEDLITIRETIRESRSPCCFFIWP